MSNFRQRLQQGDVLLGQMILDIALFTGPRVRMAWSGEREDGIEIRVRGGQRFELLLID